MSLCYKSNNTFLRETDSYVFYNFFSVVECFKMTISYCVQCWTQSIVFTGQIWRFACADPEGGTGGPDPRPVKSQIYRVS